MNLGFPATWIGALLVTLAGCAVSPTYVPETQPLEPGRLPAPDVVMKISGLGPCTDAADRSVHLNSHQPVTVLVHGCKGSAGRFRSLAQLYAFHGQQAVCFSYDDRASLVHSSDELVTALEELSGHMQNRQLSVLGHSMGGLVARKALERTRPDPWQRDDVNLKLLTISAPFAGIGIAEHCGYKTAHWLTLGIVPAICMAITGDNWYEITSASEFIRRPGPLLPSVQRYLKIVTDERDTCRRRGENGRCVASDYVFSLDEQYQPLIDSAPQLINVEVDAGHVEIVGDKNIIPRKLLAILQEQNMLAPTPPERRAALERLLAELY
ncbi:MAG: hydrolase [Thiotrichales bacterium SG8_50]|nr:MAG: hydrolase [Thiotrichales bacterium SG8_50]